MTNRFNTTTGKRRNRTLEFFFGMIILAITMSANAVAHAGFDHIRGTVVKVADNVLTVATATGNVDVKLDNRTELTRDGQKAQLTELKPGTRVIVDVPEGRKDKIAHSVKIGAFTRAVVTKPR